MLKVLQRNNVEYREMVHQLQGPTPGPLPNAYSADSESETKSQGDPSFLRDENDKLKAELAVADRRAAGVGSMKDELEGLRASNRKLLLSFSNARKLLQTSAEEKGRLAGELSTMTSRYETLRAEEDTRQLEHTRQHCRSTKALQESQQVYTSLEDRFDEQCSKLQSTERNLAQLRSDHEQANNEIESFKSSCENLKRQLDVEVREVARLRSDIDTRWKARVVSLEQELNVMVSQRQLDSSQRTVTTTRDISLQQDLDVSEPLREQSVTYDTRGPPAYSHVRKAPRTKSNQSRSDRSEGTICQPEKFGPNTMDDLGTHHHSATEVNRTPKLQAQRKVAGGEEDIQDRTKGYLPRVEVSLGVPRYSGLVSEPLVAKSSCTPRQSKPSPTAARLAGESPTTQSTVPAGPGGLPTSSCKRSTVQTSNDACLVSKKIPQRVYGTCKASVSSTVRPHCRGEDSTGARHL
eukprot:GHVS01068748.1.p1 GENE.GHVS01068748.1~~GHVS01068748.1.p1  ORF type:complete len:464 (-),score=34.51 GHVS01068748.1:6-1397(-)